MADEQQHTPGPWRWEINEKSREVHLSGGRPAFDLSVLDFVRWGMGGASPRFNVAGRDGLNLMHRADEFAVPVAGREHHSYWFQGLSHPDADLIAAAPDLLAACRLVHALGEAERREGSDALWTDEFRSIFEAANAAIDKAEGRVGGDDAGL